MSFILKRLRSGSAAFNGKSRFHEILTAFGFLRKNPLQPPSAIFLACDGQELICPVDHDCIFLRGADRALDPFQDGKENVLSALNKGLRFFLGRVRARVAFEQAIERDEAGELFQGVPA